ncbi:SIS domain-containing protein [Geminicoccus roseus]|uniref:SIS domain-containing protein n=1 Tax=Geminicoccus roseus TaxID=404900 RepID=UPI0003F99BD9|nr:SIS domain-containing protein [Geminicoccus roseus]
MDTSFQTLSQGALQELGELFARLPEQAADELIDALIAARTSALHGLGREGLQMRGFAMRLFHMGRPVHVVGDMTVPPLGQGDLLFVSIGPGKLRTTETLMQIARDAGARVALITAQPDGPAAKLADIVVHLPAQTMANDQGATGSVLPMGSLFETAQMLFFEFVILKMRARVGETAETMRARHTNLE